MVQPDERLRHTLPTVVDGMAPQPLPETCPVTLDGLVAQ